MKLRARLGKLEEVDEKYRDLYVKRGEEYVFAGVEGHGVENVEALQTSLVKARDFGDAQKEKLRPWERAFGDKKPEEVQAALDKTEEYRLASEGKLDEGEIEKRVEARIATAKAPLERQLETLKEERDTAKTTVGELEQQIKGRTIGEQVIAAGLEAGVDPKAAKPGAALMALCGQIFELGADGKPVTKADCGFPQGLSPADLMPRLKEQHDYLWATSSGGGGRNGERGSGGGKTNPWNRDPKANEWSRTEQMRIAKQEPELAAELKKAAGYEGSTV